MPFLTGDKIIDMGWNSLFSLIEFCCSISEQISELILSWFIWVDLSTECEPCHSFPTISRPPKPPYCPTPSHEPWSWEGEEQVRIMICFEQHQHVIFLVCLDRLLHWWYAGAPNLRPYSVNHQSIFLSWRKLHGVGYKLILELSGLTSLDLAYIIICRCQVSLGPEFGRSFAGTLLHCLLFLICLKLSHLHHSGTFLLASLTRSWRENEKNTGSVINVIIKVLFNKEKDQEKKLKNAAILLPPFSHRSPQQTWIAFLIRNSEAQFSVSWRNIWTAKCIV